jgi:hypothetical protein
VPSVRAYGKLESDVISGAYTTGLVLMLAGAGKRLSCVRRTPKVSTVRGGVLEVSQFETRENAPLLRGRYLNNENL